MNLKKIDQAEAVKVLSGGGRVYALTPISEDSTIKELLGAEHFAIIDNERPAKAVSKPAEKKAKYDIGKICALYNAGWSMAKIGDELGCSAQTVKNYLDKYTKEKPSAEAETAETQKA